MRALAALLVIIAGCSGDKEPIVGEPDPQVGDDDDSLPTGPIRSDEGSVVVLSWLPSVAEQEPETVVLGMFVETRRDMLNLAQCVGSSTSFCARELPQNPGDSVLVEPLDPALLGELTTRDVGDQISLGEWSANYAYDSSSDLGFYYGLLPNVQMPSGRLGLTVDGEWGPYAGTDDLVAPTAMALTSHDPLTVQEFFDVEPIALRWAPGDAGDVYLYVSSPVEQRLYLLDDDGEFDLDLTPLGLSDEDDVEMFLGRWSVATVDHDGHEVNVQVQSNQRIRGTWRTIGERTELTGVFDECAAAEGAASAVPGNYFGSIQGFARDLNPGQGGCTGYAAQGVDGIVPIDLQPEDLLTVNYQLPSDDASLYLLTDCSDAATCLVGNDQTQNGGLETVVFFNDTPNPVRVYAILDAFDQVTDIFRLDIIIDSLGGDILVPTCVDALDQGPAPAGSYHGTIAGNTDLLDPACAAPAGGGEGMTQVYLLPGERLTATATVLDGGDPKLYLLYNCSISDSCFLANDTGAGGEETLVYENATGFSEFLYLVVDGEFNLGEYFLDITIQ